MFDVHEKTCFFVFYNMILRHKFFLFSIACMNLWLQQCVWKKLLYVYNCVYGHGFMYVQRLLFLTKKIIDYNELHWRVKYKQW